MDEIDLILKSLKCGSLYEVTNTPPYLSHLPEQDWTGTVFSDHLDIVQNMNLTQTQKAIYTRVHLCPSLDQFIVNSDVKINTVIINVKGDEIEVLMGLAYTLQHHLINHVIIRIYPSLRPAHLYLNLLLKITKRKYTAFHVQGETIVPYNLENLHLETEKTLLISDNLSTSC